MRYSSIIIMSLLFPVFMLGQTEFEQDTFSTSSGDLTITFIGHGTLLFEHNDKVIHVDPWSRLADYKTLPKADIVLITHHHGDHLDEAALDVVMKERGTDLIWTAICAAKNERTGFIMANGDKTKKQGIVIEAVPAYNLEKKFHPRGDGNGYVLNFAELRVYIAGDTENIPEMTELEDIDIAFIPMNLPYTMTPEMTADAARMVNPRIFYPYHYGDTNTDELVNLLKDDFRGEIRIRQLQ